MRLLLLLVLVFFLPAVLTAQDKLNGIWNCHLECPGGDLRFKIELVSDNTNGYKAFVLNGSESIPIPSVKLSEREILFDFDHYDSRIRCSIINDGQLSGTWKKRRGADRWVEMTFKAKRANDKTRAGDLPSELANKFAGKWRVDFAKSDDPSVALFKSSQGNVLDGTFLTTTGDYRFLHGAVIDKEMELSCFDGAHAFLFRAKFVGDDLVGNFWSSNTWHENWKAVRDDTAMLPDAFAQTTLAANHPIESFAFPDLNGTPTRLDDAKFNGDAKLIYVFGSWCPNCHDAAAYFKKLKTKYGTSLSIVGLAFEHTGNFDRDAEQVRKYLKRHEVDYPVLVAGLSDKALASKTIPFLDRVRSYPTTIFMDAKNEVHAIHTGFTGPATGEAYQNMQTKFETIIDRLLEKK